MIIYSCHGPQGRRKIGVGLVPGFLESFPCGLLGAREAVPAGRDLRKVSYPGFTPGLDESSLQGGEEGCCFSGVGVPIGESRCMGLCESSPPTHSHARLRWREFRGRGGNAAYSLGMAIHSWKRSLETAWSLRSRAVSIFFAQPPLRSSRVPDPAMTR